MAGVAALAVVAVFAIQDKNARFTAEEIEQLTSYLSAQIASSGRYRVVPESEMHAAIANAKSDSYKSCYDEQCQIEIGRELAAEKTIATQIIAVGSRCAIVSTLYDLRTSASERSATEKTDCERDKLVEALEKVARSLQGDTFAPGSAALGVLSIDSAPQGTEIFVNGDPVGTTPVTIRELAPGSYRIRATREGFFAVEKTTDVVAGHMVRLELQLIDKARAQQIDEARSDHATLGLVGLGAGVALGAASAVLFVMKNAAETDASDRYLQYYALRGDAAAAGYGEVESAVSRHNALLYSSEGVAIASLGALAFGVYELISTPEAITPEGAVP